MDVAVSTHFVCVYRMLGPGGGAEGGDGLLVIWGGGGGGGDKAPHCRPVNSECDTLLQEISCSHTQLLKLSPKAGKKL